MGDGSWLSVHVSSPSDDLDDVLLHVIRPLLSTRELQTYVQCCFFIRHSAGGAHVRLRCFGVTSDLQHAVVPALERALKPRDPQDHPTRIAYVPYVPETDRFGGRQGLALAEQHFHHSSALALRIVEATQGAPACRYAYCLALMACALDQLELFGAQRADFWRIYVDRALLSTVRSQREVLGQALKAGRPPLSSAPAASSGNGSAAHSPTASGAHQAAVIEAWGTLLRSDIARLRAIRPMLSTTIIATVANFIHLLNNRLGVQLHQEAQLAMTLAAETEGATFD